MATWAEDIQLHVVSDSVQGAMFERIDTYIFCPVML